VSKYTETTTTPLEQQEFQDFNFKQYLTDIQMSLSWQTFGILCGVSVPNINYPVIGFEAQRNNKSTK